MTEPVGEVEQAELLPELVLEEIPSVQLAEPEQVPEQVPELESPGALHAVTIRNPALFQLHEMRNMFIRAFVSDEGKHLPNAIEAIEWCEEFCLDPTTAVIVAVEGLEPNFVFRGLLVLDHNPGPWSMAPQWLHIHSTGTDVIRLLCEEGSNWLHQIGQHQVSGINMMDISDAAHARLFKTHFTSEKIGTAVLATLREDSE